MSETYVLDRGSLPVLVSIPHAGTLLPPGLESRLTPVAARLPDTDWHVGRLYDQAGGMGAGVIRANYSRYVVDLNRPPDGSSLYRQSTPGLVPERTFAGEPVYRGAVPDADEIASRVDKYWRPYHLALESELDRIRAEHGFAVLFDAHSIRSRVPALFDGRLPDLNLGTWDGRSAHESLVVLVTDLLASQGKYSHVIDDRFKGGYITRHYGRPERNLHAMQLEMSQAVYMSEDPPAYNEAMSKPVKSLIVELLSRIATWRPARA